MITAPSGISPGGLPTHGNARAAARRWLPQHADWKGPQCCAHTLGDRTAHRRSRHGRASDHQAVCRASSSTSFTCYSSRTSGAGSRVCASMETSRGGTVSAPGGMVARSPGSAQRTRHGTEKAPTTLDLSRNSSGQHDVGAVMTGCACRQKHADSGRRITRPGPESRSRIQPTDPIGDHASASRAAYGCGNHEVSEMPRHRAPGPRATSSPG